MRLRLIPGACGMLLFSLGLPAYGVTCYQIWDSRDSLVYQSILPPFNLARPAFEREMTNLRNQRRTFIFFETLDCAITGSSLTGPQSRSASADPASLLDIRSSIVPSYGRSSGGTLSPVPGSIGATPVGVGASRGGTGGVPSGATAVMSVGASSPASRY